MNNVIYTKLSVFRNLKDYKFVSKLTSEKAEEIEQKVKDVFKDFKYIENSKKDKKYIEFINKNYFKNANTNCLIDTKNGILINLLNGEHIEICVAQTNLTKALKKIKECVDTLAKNLNLAYQDNYGYLMSDLTKIGCGLMVESEIYLPSIAELNKIEQIKQNLKTLGYNLKSTKNKKIFNLTSTCALGLTETEIVEEFEKTLQKLQDIENESAKLIDVNNHDKLVDEAMRAYAILNNAYLLTGEEINNLLVKVITGLNLNLIDADLINLQKLENLAYNQNNEFMSVTEMKQLAEQTKNILKGE